MSAKEILEWHNNNNHGLRIETDIEKQLKHKGLKGFLKLAFVGTLSVSAEWWSLEIVCYVLFVFLFFCAFFPSKKKVAFFFLCDPFTFFCTLLCFNIQNTKKTQI